MSAELTKESLRSHELSMSKKNVDIDALSDGDCEDEETTPKTGCCGFFHNNRLLATLIFMAMGVAVGIGLSFWTPEDPHAKDVTIQWVGLVGQLFFRSVICFVIPLIFVNIITAIVDMMNVGNATSIGYTVIALYLTTTVAAATFGIVSTLVFMGFYKAADEAIEDTGASGQDIDLAEVTISDTIYDGIFMDIVPRNIFKAFSEGSFTAIMFFAAIFGIALYPELKGGAKESALYKVLKEMDKVFTRVIRWIIFLTPFAVFSLVAAGIGNQSDLVHMFSNVGLLIAASFLGWALQITVVYMGLFSVLTKSNPLAYLKHIVPAQLFAFSTASSAATIPASLAAVKSTGRVPDVIGRFVIPFGAIVNMDGSAVYFTCTTIWLGILNGEDITFVSFIMAIIICTIGSIGTAPVPQAGMVLILTAYQSVFGASEGLVPHGFEYVFAIDWFMDRMQTMGNVTGDCMIAGIVAHRCAGANIEGLDETMTETDIGTEKASVKEGDNRV